MKLLCTKKIVQRNPRSKKPDAKEEEYVESFNIHTVLQLTQISKERRF